MTVVATSSYTPNTVGPSVPVVMPVGGQAGDVAFMWVGSNTGTATCTTPDGWTLVEGPVRIGSTLSGWLFSKTLDGTEGGTTVTATLSAGGKRHAGIVVMRSTATTYTATSWSDSSADSVLSIPAFTPAVDAAQVVVVTLSRYLTAVGEVSALPAGYTEDMEAVTAHGTLPEFGVMAAHKTLGAGTLNVAQPAEDGTYSQPASTIGWVITIASDSPEPLPSPFVWKGHQWTVRTGASLSPGPNPFVGDGANLSVDDNGDLSMSIVYSPALADWTCVEVHRAGAPLGYGRYRWVVEHTEVSTWDQKPVLGLFTYDDAEPTATHFREIDIELSKWDYAPEVSEVWYTVQPSTPSTRWDHPIPVAAGPYTYEFYWEPSKVYWRTLDALGNVVGEAKTVYGLFPPGTESVRMNLWLINGEAPVNGLPLTVKVKDFQFTPDLSFGEPADRSWPFDTEQNTWLRNGAYVDAAGSALVLPTQAATYSLARTPRLLSLKENGRTIDAEVLQVSAAGSGSTEQVFWLGYADDSNYAGFLVANGGLTWRHRVGGVNTGASIAPYSATTHRWLRVERSNANLLFRTSPDGVAWTTHATSPVGWSAQLASTLHGNIESGYYGTEVDPLPLRVGTLRMGGPAPLPQVTLILLEDGTALMTEDGGLAVLE